MQSRLNGMRISEGFTGHERHTPASNAFRYPVLYIQFNTESAEAADQTLRQRLKFFSLRPQDYLFKKSSDLNREIRNLLQEHFNYPAGDIHLLTIPRMFGYAFNPVSFWLCRREGRLDAVLCEVNNTFGERHFYWIKAHQGDWSRAEKCFHVSPFLPVEGFYQFRFLEEENRFRADINYHSPSGEKILSTWLDVKHRPVEQAALFPLLARYGWITVLVMVRIHFQALKLFFKKVRFYSKPALPKDEVTQ